MDFLTAGIALVATLVCVALVMTGIWVAASNETCTRYWAIAEALLALGVLLIVLNTAASSRLVMVVSNNLMIWGALLQWRGIQAFYREPPAKAMWAIALGFFMLHALLVLAAASMPAKLLLFSFTLLALLGLSLRTLLRNTASDPSFGSRLLVGATALLIANNLLRIAAVLLQAFDLRPATPSTGGVTILYLIPLAGILLYATGLLVIYFERLVAEKHFLATHDELTGLLNRRALAAVGTREIEVAGRNRMPLAVALVDIDHFKDVNDRFGHEAGDQVLVEITRLLKDSCRGIDLVGRYGGEEFCIVLPNVDGDQCPLIGERLVNATRRYRYLDRYPVTVSAGFAVLAPGQVPRSWSELIKRADREMYKAKNLGRNQFCVEADRVAGPLAPAADARPRVAVDQAGDV